jgi:hypothetical protein
LGSQFLNCPSIAQASTKSLIIHLSNQTQDLFMEPVIPVIHSASNFAYEDYDSHSQVMAYNRSIKQWEMVELYEVEDGISPYTKFFFIDQISAPEEDSQFEAVKDKVNEMVAWINKWSVKSAAVDEALNDFRSSIFDLLDDIEESQS